jgi:hypothetical protein
MIPGILPSGSATSHRWKFIRVGGVLQVVFRSGADIVNLEHLDQKLWVALACPTKGVEFDERTLDLLDIDRDGRIRAPEVVEITRWVRDVFRDPDVLLKASDSVELSALNNTTPAGTAILASAQRVLSRVGRADATAVTLADVTELSKNFGGAKFNGDSIVPVDSAPDDDTKKAIADILSTHTGVADRGGKFGVNQATLDAFFNEATALLTWSKKSGADAAILPLGEKTAGAAAALQAVRAKINDYFARTQLAAFDQRAGPILNRAEADYIAFAAKDLRTDAQEIAQLPLAHIAPGRPLPLRNGINPAWQGAIGKFVAETVTPLLGARDSLTEEDWGTLQGKVAAYEQWLGSKPASTAEKLGLPRLQQLVESGIREKLNALVQQDAAEALMNDDMRSVERLIRVQRDLFRFLNNFVSFSDFYARRGAIFQAGTLYLDARSCELCVHVPDAAKHTLLAGLAKAYLAYCDCTRVGGKKMVIAAAFTAGDSDHLMVGRNGVFYDRSGQDWDATITKIIDNPISIRQAFWSPYKKFVRMVEEQVAKRAAAAEAASQAKLTGAATTVASVDLTKPAAPAAPAPGALAPAKVEPKKVDVGAVAALGVALGSLATFLGLMFTKVVDLGWWAPFAIIGILLAISLPSVLIAWLKLRQRNLGPILDANGWAINGRMKINVPFGGALSKRATLPGNAQLQLADPFYESHAGRYTVITLIVLLILLGTLWRFGFLDRFLPPSLDRKPAATVVVPAGQTQVVPAGTPVVITPATTVSNAPVNVVTNK